MLDLSLSSKETIQCTIHATYQHVYVLRQIKKKITSQEGASWFWFDVVSKRVPGFGRNRFPALIQKVSWEWVGDPGSGFSWVVFLCDS